MASPIARGASVNHTAPPARLRSGKPIVRQIKSGGAGQAAYKPSSTPERPSKLNVKA